MNKTFLKSKWFLPCFSLFFLTVKMAYLDYEMFGASNIFYTIILELPWMVGFIILIEVFFIKRKFLGYLIINTVLSALFLTILMYFQHFGNVITIDALHQAKQVTKVKESVASLIRYEYIFFFLDIVSLLLWHRYYSKSESAESVFQKKYLALLLLVPVIWITAVTYWKYDRNIVNEFEVSKSVGVFNYQLVFLKKEIEEKTRTPEKVTLKKIQDIKGNQVLAKSEHQGIASGKNLIIIQFESLQEFVINQRVNNQEITPNLNALLEEVTYFPHFFHQVGKGNTSDAEFAVNTSIYPIGKYAMAQEFGDRAFPSMPKLLKEEGYTTATFHTNKKSFWNRENLYPALGFDTIYDEEFFGNEQFLRFGSVDEILYEKTLPELVKFNNTEDPFYSHIIAMTSHHPYEMPEELESLALPKEIDGNLIGDYFQSVHYSDKALGQFIQDLKATGLWEDSIVVVYGDHTGLRMKNLTDTDLEYLNTLTGEVYTDIETLNVPLFLYVPELEASVKENVGNQVDILPTVMNLMGISLEDEIYFGQDLLNQKKNLIPERHYVPNGSFINENIGFIPKAKFEEGDFYSFKEDSTIKDIKQHKEDYLRALRLLRLSDDYLKSIPVREKENEQKIQID